MYLIKHVWELGSHTVAIVQLWAILLCFPDLNSFNADGFFKTYFFNVYCLKTLAF